MDMGRHDSRREQVGRGRRREVHVLRYGVGNGSGHEGSSHRDEVVGSDVDSHHHDGDYMHVGVVHDGCNGHLREGSHHHDEVGSGSDSGRYGGPHPGS